QFLRANHLERVMVQDVLGGLIGVITRAELVSAVCGRVRPPLVGGMATPFGVYLTGGGVRGGVGDLALMTTGMYLATIQLVAYVLAFWVAGPGGWVYTLRVPVEWLNWVARNGLEAPQWLFFALLFKLSWFITGYHAAEHQVVHTIEAGDDLQADVVSRKPRVHPRCGTNLVAAVMIMGEFWKLRFGPLDQDGLLMIIALLTTLFLWRRFGGLLQQHVTTSPANPQQLRSGITAAQELMDRYQQRPDVRPRMILRIWNMGLIQVMSGSLVVIGIMTLLARLNVPLPPALQGF
ncbi:MAG: metal-dependent enzyme-like protein, partial [Armatimonadetes bacterium]|nr:metal-dependent enzyme-like protein [Armatimonadota bacterium]